MADGLGRSGLQLADGLAKTRLTYLNIKNDVVYTLRDTQLEFEKFKKTNNLDHFFSLDMDPVKAKRILEEIKDIMQSTDWHVTDKELLNKANASEVTTFLTNICADYENFLA